MPTNCVLDPSEAGTAVRLALEEIGNPWEHVGVPYDEVLNTLGEKARIARVLAGDLITTSDTPGHGMKVTDHVAAQGAIIGKAMTGLDEGTGLVLVLLHPGPEILGVFRIAVSGGNRGQATINAL